MTDSPDYDDTKIISASLLGLAAAALSGAVVGMIAGALGAVLFILWEF